MLSRLRNCRCATRERLCHGSLHTHSAQRPQAVSLGCIFCMGKSRGHFLFTPNSVNLHGYRHFCLHIHTVPFFFVSCCWYKLNAWPLRAAATETLMGCLSSWVPRGTCATWNRIPSWPITIPTPGLLAPLLFAGKGLGKTAVVLDSGPICLYKPLPTSIVLIRCFQIAPWYALLFLGISTLLGLQRKQNMCKLGVPGHLSLAHPTYTYVYGFIYIHMHIYIYMYIDINTPVRMFIYRFLSLSVFPFLS